MSVDRPLGPVCKLMDGERSRHTGPAASPAPSADRYGTGVVATGVAAASAIRYPVPVPCDVLTTWPPKSVAVVVPQLANRSGAASTSTSTVLRMVRYSVGTPP